jgi:hypothetical protein
MTKWFVTVDKYCSYPNPEEHVWTISRDPNDTGWETDSGYSGYGLLKKDAEELANAANRIEKLEAALTHIWAWYPVSVSKPYETIDAIKDYAFAAIKGEKKDD